MPAKKLSGRQLVEEILRLSDQLEGQFRREFLSAIAGVSSSRELRRLLADIANGNISFGDPIDVRLSRVVIPTAKLDEIARKAMGSAARSSASIVPRVQPRFDVTNPTVVSLARRMSIDLSTNLNATTKENIRQIIVDALEGNITQAEAARKIRTQVGLTPSHAEAVDRYYQRMIESGTKKSIAQKRADQYAKRLLDSRARTIARTEIANAVGKGQSEMWKQMKRDGYLPPSAVKSWVTAADERVCPICGPMNGVEAEVDGFWNVGGIPIEYPQASHPNCRCTSVISEPSRARIGKNDDTERDHWILNFLSKANPYRDERGRFSTKNKAAAPKALPKKVAATPKPKLAPKKVGRKTAAAAAKRTGAAVVARKKKAAKPRERWEDTDALAKDAVGGLEVQKRLLLLTIKSSVGALPPLTATDATSVHDYLEDNAGALKNHVSNRIARRLKDTVSDDTLRDYAAAEGIDLTLAPESLVGRYGRGITGFLTSHHRALEDNDRGIVRVHGGSTDAAKRVLSTELGTSALTELVGRAEKTGAYGFPFTGTDREMQRRIKAGEPLTTPPKNKRLLAIGEASRSLDSHLKAAKRSGSKKSNHELVKEWIDNPENASHFEALVESGFATMLSHRFNFGKPGEIASSFRSGLEIMEREGFVAHSTYDSGFVSQSFGRALSLVHVSDKSAEAQAVRRGASSVEALEQTVGNREPKPKNIQFTSQDVGKVTHRDRTEIASEMLQSWAQSSSSGAGLSMSRAAEEIFGKRSSSYAKYDGEYDPLNVRQRLELEVSKAVVKAMYADTQETLSAAGITSMVVHRGYVAQSKDSSPHPVRTRLEQSADGIVPVVGEQRPLSSWSTDIYLAADQFGENKQGTTTGLDRRVDAQIVATRIVAAKDIVALPTTGIGAARESEVVILTRERGSRGFDWAQETTDLTQPGSTMFKVGIEILGERLGLSKEQTKQIKEGAISF